MAITAEVVALYHDSEFRDYVRLNFITVADSILGGNFPNNVTTNDEKTKVTDYARQVFQGQGNLNVWVDAVLAQPQLQNLINATPQGDYLAALQVQAGKQFKVLSGIVPVYE